MRLGREVDDFIDVVLIPRRANKIFVDDVAFDKYQALVVEQILQIPQVPRVGQLIKRDELHVFAALPQNETHEVGADEACRAGDENGTHDDKSYCVFAMISMLL